MIDAMVITYNEAVNIPHSLRALRGWTNKCFVVDSGSTDGTQDIARELGAEVVRHDWEGYARQKNWALDNLPFESPWILVVDADEIITPRLRNRLTDIASLLPEHVAENGFFINRVQFFLGRPIIHCGLFPNWNLRFFKHGAGRYEPREVHEHVVIGNPVGYIKEAMIHDDRRGLEHYYAKHNRYSTLEARALFRETGGTTNGEGAPNLSGIAGRRRWLKRYVMPNIPMPGLWRFTYMYLAQLGFLDGRTGFEYCKFIAGYDAQVVLKLRELRRQSRSRRSATREVEETSSDGGLAVAEGGELVVPAGLRDGGTTRRPAPVPSRPQPAPPRARKRVRRLLWRVTGKPLFRLSPGGAYGFRCMLLRLFGASIGRRVAMRPSADLETPWTVEIGDDTTVGDYAILRGLGRITIGARSAIGPYAYLCSGTHAHADRPVRIGDNVRIETDAFVGPGVTVGDGCRLGARSSALSDLPAGTDCDVL